MWVVPKEERTDSRFEDGSFPPGTGGKKGRRLELDPRVISTTAGDIGEASTVTMAATTMLVNIKPGFDDLAGEKEDEDVSKVGGGEDGKNPWSKEKDRESKDTGDVYHVATTEGSLDKNSDDWDVSLHQEDDEVDVTYATNYVTGSTMKGRKISIITTTEALLDQNADDWGWTIATTTAEAPLDSYTTTMLATNNPGGKKSDDLFGDKEEDVDKDAGTEELAESLWSTVLPGDVYHEEHDKKQRTEEKEKESKDTEDSLYLSATEGPFDQNSDDLDVSQREEDDEVDVTDASNAVTGATMKGRKISIITTTEALYDQNSDDWDYDQNSDDWDYDQNSDDLSGADEEKDPAESQWSSVPPGETFTERDESTEALIDATDQNDDAGDWMTAETATSTTEAPVESNVEQNSDNMYGEEDSILDQNADDYDHNPDDLDNIEGEVVWEDDDGSMWAVNTETSADPSNEDDAVKNDAIPVQMVKDDDLNMWKVPQKEIVGSTVEPEWLSQGTIISPLNGQESSQRPTTSESNISLSDVASCRGFCGSKSLGSCW